MAGFTPLHDKVLIKPDDATGKTAGGLFIPDDAKEKSTTGTVIAAGKGKTTESGTLIPMSLKPGDKIMYPKFSGDEIEIEGVKHLIIPEEQIIGIIS